MVLSWSADVWPADWLTDGDPDVWQLINFGPAGFADYARLRFIPDPTAPDQSETDVDDADVPESEVALVRGVLDVLAAHTTTPDDCYFCLWEGWGSTLRGGDVTRIANPETRTVTRGPTTAPAFDLTILDGPKVSIPYRDYLLFHGPLSDFGDWGAADALPGVPRTDMPNPAFIWPADHAWCVANDVDPHWAGIGASTAAVDELLRVDGLDIVRADPAEPQLAYR